MSQPQHVSPPQWNGAAWMYPPPPPARVPTAAASFWCSFLFGPLGVLVAVLHANEARRAGAPTERYVGACVFGLLLSALVVGVLLVVTGAL